jgi:adenine-specific DNA-methyltransferase
MAPDTSPTQPIDLREPNSLKEEMLKRLDSYASNELKRLLVDLLTRQRLGLYWERDVIEQDRAINDSHVFLELAEARKGESLSCGEGPYQNLIIEGDNFDALRLLRSTHAGRVRLILIDPPYNTGNKDFVYNDRFVRKDDRYRHSMWLDWLYRRLTLARDLLSQDGAILVCINDENRAKLELLMDEVFAGMRIGSFVWKTRSGTQSAGHAFSVDHEHVLIYGGPDFEFTGVAKDFKQYKETADDDRGPWKTGDLTKGHSWRDRPGTYYPVRNPESDIYYPCNPTRVWAYSTEQPTPQWKEALMRPRAKGKGKAAALKQIKKSRKPTMEEWIRQKKIVWPDPTTERVVTWNTREELIEAIRAGDVPRANRGRTPLLTEDLPDLDFWVGKKVSFERPWFKRHLRDVKSSTSIISSWIRGISEASDLADEDVAEVVTQRSGTSEDSVKEILGAQVFDFPKPPSLFREILRYATDTNDIVLDFFAGSGTLGQAVLELNAEDGGNRRFILASSTEATDTPSKNLCRDVCAERVRRIIEGYGEVEGIDGDFAYVRTVRVEPSDLIYEVTAERAWHTLSLLHTGTITPYTGSPVSWLASTHDTAVVLCFDTTEEALRQLAEITVSALLVYTDAPAAVINALPGRTVEAIDVFDAVRTAAFRPERRD